MIVKLKALTPMTKISGEYKNRFRIIKIPCKYLPIFIRHLLINGPCHNGNKLNISAQTLDNKGQVHFKTMLILLIINIDHMKALLFLQLVNGLDINTLTLNIDRDGSHRGVILISIGQSAARKVLVMGRSEKEHPLYACIP